MSNSRFTDLDWADPHAAFRVHDDGNPHGKLYIVFPGGQLVDVGCHADPVIDRARADWVCSALNEARQRDLRYNTPHHDIQTL